MATVPKECYDLVLNKFMKSDWFKNSTVHDFFFKEMLKLPSVPKKVVNNDRIWVKPLSDSFPDEEPKVLGKGFNVIEFSTVLRKMGQIGISLKGSAFVDPIPESPFLVSDDMEKHFQDLDMYFDFDERF